jgi:hypothetical protein
LYRLQQNGDFAFTVLKRTPSYEIRQYEPFLQVETGVAASDIATALENGKRDLEMYIQGQNTREKVVKTIPPFFVSKLPAELAKNYPRSRSFSEILFELKHGKQNEESSQKVYVVSRALSPEYSVAQIPKSWNPFIFITESKRETVAVRRFGGWITKKSVLNNLQKLDEDLKRDGNKYTSVKVAEYSHPHLFIFRRNEILVTLENRNNEGQ